MLGREDRWNADLWYPPNAKPAYGYDYYEAHDKFSVVLATPRWWYCLPDHEWRIIKRDLPNLMLIDRIG